jgi:hypothetical protein
MGHWLAATRAWVGWRQDNEEVRARKRAEEPYKKNEIEEAALGWVCVQTGEPGFVLALFEDGARGLYSNGS